MQILIGKDIWFNDDDGEQSLFTFYHPQDATQEQIDAQVAECCKILMRSVDEVAEIVGSWDY